MNINKILFVITALLLCTSASVIAFAEERNIYIGDIITLEILTQEFSEEELMQKFQDFEIVELKKKQGGYLLSVRTFDIGEKSIIIGDKEIVINVASSLNDIHREDIFEGEIRVIEPGFSFHLGIIFYISASIFALSGVFLLVNIIVKKKNKAESSYQLFLRRSASLSDTDDNYLVDLTFYFKEYLESLHNQQIIGKTSAEIINELKEIPALDAILSDIKEWLTECDMLKFSDIKASSDEKRRHYTWLLKIVEKIELKQIELNQIKMKQCDTNEGAA